MKEENLYMRMKKKTICMALALVAAMLTAGCGPLRVGYVNEDRIEMEAPQIKQSLEEGNKKLLEEQKALQEKLQQNPNMSKEEAEKLQKEAQMKASGIQMQYMTQVKQKMDAALADVSKEEKLEVIITSDTLEKPILYGCSDVTDKVIQKLQ